MRVPSRPWEGPKPQDWPLVNRLGFLPFVALFPYSSTIMSFAAAFVALLKRSEVLVFAPLRHDGHAPMGAGSHKGAGSHRGGGLPRGRRAPTEGGAPTEGWVAPSASDQGPLELPESPLCRGLVDSRCLSLEWSHSSLLRLTLVKLLLKPGQWTEARRGGAARGASVPRTQPRAPRGLSCSAPAPKEAAETWTGVWLVEWPVFCLER